MVGSIVLMGENSLHVLFGRETWLYSEEQWRDLLISPRRVSLA